MRRIFDNILVNKHNKICLLVDGGNPYNENDFVDIRSPLLSGEVFEKHRLKGGRFTRFEAKRKFPYQVISNHSTFPEVEWANGVNSISINTVGSWSFAYIWTDTEDRSDPYWGSFDRGVEVYYFEREEDALLFKMFI